MFKKLFTVKKETLYWLLMVQNVLKLVWWKMEKHAGGAQNRFEKE
jgi:hypothetical protein